MRPESTAVAFRADLSALANEYNEKLAAERFIGRRIAPIFVTAKQSGQYPIFNRECFKKRQDTKIAEDGTYNRVIGEFGKGTYDTDPHGLEYPINDRKRARYADLFDAEEAATRITWFQLMMDHEFRVRDMMTSAGFTNHNVTTAWSTTATAVPLTDIATGVKALKRKCGCRGMDISLVITDDDFQEMILTTQVINKTQYTYPGTIPASLAAEEVANMLKIKEILIADGSYDSTEEGYAESDASIWTAGVMYLVVTCDEGDPLETPAACRTIVWDQMCPELPFIETYREDKVESDIVRCKDDTDETLMGEADLFGYQITNT